MQKITSFRAHDGLMSLAIHPTLPYVLSSPCSRHHEKKLWNWEKGWECTQTFEREYFERDFVCQVAFDPKDANRFASTSEYTVKVWSLNSPKSNYTLPKYFDKVNFLEFFTRDDQQYLITGSHDMAARIWDMQMKKYVPNKLQTLMSPLASVFSHPNLPILLTCSSDGTSHFWSSKDFRLEGVLDYGYGGDVRGIACLMVSKSKPRCLYVIGQEAALTILDIENEKYQKDSVESSAPQSCADVKPEEIDSDVKTQGSKELLHVHSLKLHFPFQAHKLIPCPLHLTNNTDKHMAFRLSKEEGLLWWPHPFARMPLSGIVPPRSTYTLIVTMREQTNLVQEQNFNLILHSCISGDKYIYTFEDQSVCNMFFEDAKETGNVVHKVELEAVLSVQGQPMSENESTGEGAIRPLINIWGLFHPAKDFSGALCSLDADLTESWIITGHRHGDVSIWKCGTQRMMSSINTWEETGVPRNILNTQHDVYSVKFITRRRWFVAGTYDGFIHVYNYETRMEFIKKFKVHSSGIRDTGIYLSRALVVHPTKPYVLSTFEEMKLWDWDKDWKCIQTFEREHSDSIRQVAFNPKDINTFASASSDHTIKFWRLNSSISEYTLRGHSDKVNCLEFFTGDGQQYLITGSQDCTAKIWGLQEKMCVHTMDVFMSPVVSVIYLPDIQYLTTGSEDGTVHLWNSSSFRLERIFNIGCGGPVRSLCLMGSNRVVIQQEGEISIMDIDTISETSASATSNKLIRVDPPELRFPVVQEVSSALKISNITGHQVAFSIWSSSNRADYNALPTKGVLSPSATVQIVVTRVAHEWVPADLAPEEVVFVKGIVVVEGLDATDVTYDMFKPKTGRIVHEVELDIVSIASEIIPKVRLPWTLDVHPTEPWIMMTQGDYHVHIWNFKTREDKPIAIKGREVTSAKFIALKQWIMAGCSSGLIYVYSYNPVNKNPVKKIRVLQRPSKTLAVHATEPSSKSVNSLAVHATEPYVLSAFQDGKILIWNYENNWELMKTVNAKSLPVELVEFNDYGNNWELMKAFRAKSLSVDHVAFNPKDTDMFASAQDKTIKIWNLHSGECKRILSGHSGLVVCLDYFHLGGKLHLITGSHDRTAKIWDCETGRCVQTLKGHMDVVKIACCHPDLSILITGSQDGSVRLWDSTTFEHERTLNLDLGEVYAIASLRSSRIAIGNEKGLALVEIDLKDKKDVGVESTKGLAPLETNLKDKDRGVKSTKGLAPVQIDHEVKKDGVVESTETDLEDTKDGIVENTIAIMGSKKDTVRIVKEISSSIVPSELIKVDPLELRFPVAQIVSSTLKICNITDDYVAFSISSNNNTAKCTMLPSSKGVLSPQSTLDVLVRFFFPEKRKSFKPKEVVTVKSTVVEQSLMTTDVTHDMFKTETSRNVELDVFFVASKTISKIKSVCTIDVHPTDTWMVITQGDKSFRMNYRTKKVELVVLTGGKVSLAKFIAREEWIVAGFTSGLLCVYSSDSQKRIHVLREHSTSIKSLAIHGTKPYVLSASCDGKILLWDYGKGWHLIKTFDAISQLDKGNTVEQVVFNPMDTDIFASAQDKTVKIWDLHSGECKRILSGHSGLVVCLDYFHLGDKLHLITGSHDGTAKIWDCETGSCVQTLKGHTDVVKIACFHPDLLIIITASWDGSVRLWDSTNFRLERTLDFKLGKVNSVACLKGLTRIAIGHEKGLVLADIKP
uniref:Beta'-coat protein n=1 Tax=Hordeum vulgare subsp. vulgare TaxID=112509 RepID=F2DI72_HORVV|nr:predicted protein [Hordeum vulgare subsp. vulgare]